MRRLRHILAAGLVLALCGSLSVTLGYAWYYRSDAYRAWCVQMLSESLVLPAGIGAVVPRSTLSQEFRDVRVWLPERRAEIFFCEQALLQYPDRSRPDEWEIRLVRGRCEISSRAWLSEDYRRVLVSGLRPGFELRGLTGVHFEQMDVQLLRDPLELNFHNATGEVVFLSATAGRGRVVCTEFNGSAVSRPVFLETAFAATDDGVRIEHLTVEVPPVSLAELGLGAALGADLTSGEFAGQLRYTETAAGERATFSGRVTDVDLAEITALLPNPLRGRCVELDLLELQTANDRAERARFRGLLTDVVVDDILSQFEVSTGGATATLRVTSADITRSGIQRLVLSGRCGPIDLVQLTQAWDRGRMSGRALLEIRDLVIEHNRPVRLKARLAVTDTRRADRWIEGRLLQSIVEDVAATTLPPLLPQRVPYETCAAELELHGADFYILGTHGPGERFILSILLGNTPLPLIPEPSDPVDVAPFVDDVLNRAQRYWPELVTPPPATTAAPFGE